MSPKPLCLYGQIARPGDPLPYPFADNRRGTSLRRTLATCGSPREQKCCAANFRKFSSQAHSSLSARTKAPEHYVPLGHSAPKNL